MEQTSSTRMLGRRLGDLVSAANQAKKADDAREVASEKSEKTAGGGNGGGNGGGKR